MYPNKPPHCKLTWPGLFGSLINKRANNFSPYLCGSKFNIQHSMFNIQQNLASDDLMLFKLKTYSWNGSYGEGSLSVSIWMRIKIYSKLGLNKSLQARLKLVVVVVVVIRLIVIIIMIIITTVFIKGGSFSLLVAFSSGRNFNFSFSFSLWKPTKLSQTQHQ